MYSNKEIKNKKHAIAFIMSLLIQRKDKPEIRQLCKAEYSVVNILVVDNGLGIMCHFEILRDEGWMIGFVFGDG